MLVSTRRYQVDLKRRLTEKPANGDELNDTVRVYENLNSLFNDALGSRGWSSPSGQLTPDNDILPDDLYSMWGASFESLTTIENMLILTSDSWLSEIMELLHQVATNLNMVTGNEDIGTYNWTYMATQYTSLSKYMG